MIKLLSKPLHLTQVYELDNLIGENGTKVIFGLINGNPTALLNVPEFIFFGDINSKNDMIPTIRDMIPIHNQEIPYDVYSFTPVNESHQQLLNQLNLTATISDEDTMLRLHMNQRRALGDNYLLELLEQNDLYEVVPNNDLGDIIIYADPSLRADSAEYQKTRVS